MSDSNDFQDLFEEPIFTAELTPYRSLGRTGFLALMLFLSLVSFIAGIGRLRGQHNCDQQREMVEVLKLALGIGIGGTKP
jgi:hypothetical protein